MGTGTPRRSLIVDNLQSVIGAIATPTYRTTVLAVTTKFKHPEDFSGADLPSVMILPQYEYPVYIGLDARREVNGYEIAIMGVVSDSEDVEHQLSNLCEDIKEAISADPTRGGNAHTTDIQAIEFNQIDVSSLAIVTFVIQCPHNALRLTT